MSNYLFVVKGDMNRGNYRSITYELTERQMGKLHRIIELINEGIDYVSQSEHRSHLCEYRFSDEYEELCSELNL